MSYSVRRLEKVVYTWQRNSIGTPKQKNVRWNKEGRGKGPDKDYKPWLTDRDVTSEGLSHRIFGHLTHRTNHLLSDLELATFLLLQWRESTIDIREQFPLGVTITTRLCEMASIEHPTKNGFLQFMSSDFVVTISNMNNDSVALHVKNSSKLEDARTVNQRSTSPECA